LTTIAIENLSLDRELFSKPAPEVDARLEFLRDVVPIVPSFNKGTLT
jgi:hypothetical protein